MQSRRYAELVEGDASDAAQKTARAAVRECDEILDEAVDLYEIACLEESGHADDAWWHKANMVWRNARKYLRHQAASKRLLRRGNGHSKNEFMELRIEHELRPQRCSGCGTPSNRTRRRGPRSGRLKQRIAA